MRLMEEDGAGAGLAALAVVVSLLWDMMGSGLFSPAQVRRLLDRALLALEEDHHASSTAQANTAARRYLESMLNTLDRSHSALPED
jgi:hypothetical protein